MSEDDALELVRHSVAEFIEREVAPLSADIEDRGLPPSLMKGVAERGYIGATLSEESGGAGLHRHAFMMILEELSKASPSLAFYTFLQDLGARIMNQNGHAQQAVSVIGGDRKVSIMNEDVLLDRQTGMHEEGGRIRGERSFALLPEADFFVTPVDLGSSVALCVIEGRCTIRQVYRSLGFRGIKFASVGFDMPLESTLILRERDAPQYLLEFYANLSAEVSAMALGMAEAAIERAISYAGKRSTFGQRLSAYQPVAFMLSDQLAQINILRDYLFSHSPEAQVEMLEAHRMISRLALESSRISIQVHGGNGYFSDYLIERYYRDIMALLSHTGNSLAEMRRLSHLLLGVDTAYL